MSATTTPERNVIRPEAALPMPRGVGTAAAVPPSVIVLLAWMIVPLVMTLWFSFQRYNLVDPTTAGSPASTTIATW